MTSDKNVLYLIFMGKVGIVHLALVKVPQPPFPTHLKPHISKKMMGGKN